MPGFDFARGNARKLLSLPLYALGAGASLVTPRRRSRWAFGSGPGVGEGALVLARNLREQNPSAAITWLAKDAHDADVARGLGFDSVVKSSARGFWRTLRAQVIVITHGFGDVNRFATRGAFVVQLWHGVPLKLIQLDSPATMTLRIPGGWRLRGVLRRFYRRGFAAIDVMPAASELVAARLRTAFGLRDGVVVTGDPRDDALSVGTASDRRSQSRARVFELLQLPDSDQQLVLFAPTWRDGERDPTLPNAVGWRSIADHLDSVDGLLIVRPHPLGVGDYDAGASTTDRVRTLTSAHLVDLTPLLPAFDRLVTDYSSVAFDYALTGGPIFYLAPDEAAYATSRGLYEPYRDFSDSRAVLDWPAVVGQLGRYETDVEWALAVRHHSARIAERHFAFTDGRNTARVYAEISTRLDARR